MQFLCVTIMSLSMLPYSTLISLDKTAKTPVFLQIAAALTENIRRGIIPSGARLPGTRSMAEALCCIEKPWWPPMRNYSPKAG
ncbi:MAG: hypothetical protein KA138_12365 [Saprospiraceae bacterium]|nr:hypothetical protein [Saprospiraceae bacterium]